MVWPTPTHSDSVQSELHSHTPLDRVLWTVQPGAGVTDSPLGSGTAAALANTIPAVADTSAGDCATTTGATVSGVAVPVQRLGGHRSELARRGGRRFGVAGAAGQHDGRGHCGGDDKDNGDDEQDDPRGQPVPDTVAGAREVQPGRSVPAGRFGR